MHGVNSLCRMLVCGGPVKCRYVTVYTTHNILCMAAFGDENRSKNVKCMRVNNVYTHTKHVRINTCTHTHCTCVCTCVRM